MRFSTFSTGFSTTKGTSPIRTVIQAAAFWKVLDENAGILPFIKKKVEGFSLHSTNRSRAAIYFSPIWNEPVTSFQHRAAAVFLCGKGGETCSFPHRKKLLLAGAPGANSPSLAALDRFPFLSLRDIFPRPGEVVLWDGAFGSTEKFPAKVQSLRHARGSLFEGAGKTVRF